MKGNYEVMKFSISEMLMHSTIRIEILNENKQVVSTGTGFFFDFKINDKYNVPVLVTNKHVIKDAQIGRLVFTISKEGKPVYGEKFMYEIQAFEELFILHPEQDVDLCVMPINPVVKDAQIKYNKTLFYISLGESIIAHKEQLEGLNALEDIIMIGYPNGLWDAENNLPIIRKGITAVHPKFDYNGKTDIVMDIASFPGSSGSPVCIYNQGSYSKGNDITIGTRLMFLGILYAGPQQTVIGEIATKVVPTSVIPVPVSNVMMNLDYAVKSERLLDFKPIIKSKLIENTSVEQLLK